MKKLVDTYFIVNKSGKFLDLNGAFTLSAPFDDNIYKSLSQSDAQAHLTSLNLTNCSVMDIQRFQ